MALGVVGRYPFGGAMRHQFLLLLFAILSGIRRVRSPPAGERGRGMATGPHRRVPRGHRRQFRGAAFRRSHTPRLTACPAARRIVLAGLHGRRRRQRRPVQPGRTLQRVRGLGLAFRRDRLGQPSRRALRAAPRRPAPDGGRVPGLVDLRLRQRGALPRVARRVRKRVRALPARSSRSPEPSSIGRSGRRRRTRSGETSRDRSRPSARGRACRCAGSPDGVSRSSRRSSVSAEIRLGTCATISTAARVAELADARDLGSRGETLEGSNPSSRTNSEGARIGFVGASCGTFQTN